MGKSLVISTHVISSHALFDRFLQFPNLHSYPRQSFLTLKKKKAYETNHDYDRLGKHAQDGVWHNTEEMEVHF